MTRIKHSEWLQWRSRYYARATIHDPIGHAFVKDFRLVDDSIAYIINNAQAEREILERYVVYP